MRLPQIDSLRHTSPALALAARPCGAWRQVVVSISPQHKSSVTGALSSRLFCHLQPTEMKEGELGARKRMIGNREMRYFVIIGHADWA